MIIKTYISVGLFFVLFSCTSAQKKEEVQPSTPNALKDKGSVSEVVSKRSYDLVEELYDELVNNNVDLKEIEGRLDQLNKSKDDSILSFEKYNVKNQTFFISAKSHASQISDSILRKRMEDIVNNNIDKYNLKIVHHNILLKNIEANNTQLTDLHNIIKILRTLPLIEQYQKNELPKEKPLESYIEIQKGVLNDLDTLTKK